MSTSTQIQAILNGTILSLKAVLPKEVHVSSHPLLQTLMNRQKLVF